MREILVPTARLPPPSSGSTDLHVHCLLVMIAAWCKLPTHCVIYCVYWLRQVVLHKPPVYHRPPHAALYHRPPHAALYHRPPHAALYHRAPHAALYRRPHAALYHTDTPSHAALYPPPPPHTHTASCCTPTASRQRRTVSGQTINLCMVVGWGQCLQCLVDPSSWWIYIYHIGLVVWSSQLSRISSGCDLNISRGTYHSMLGVKLTATWGFACLFCSSVVNQMKL